MPAKQDYAAHNAEVRALWEGFEARRPSRVPVVFNFSMRYFLLHPEANPEGYTFQEYFESPEIAFTLQMRRHRWIRYNVPEDAEMGPPDQEWPGPWVDFQNSWEAMWWGCPLQYLGDSPPDTVPILHRREQLRDLEPPHPTKSPAMARILEFYQYFEERRSRFEMEGKPVARASAPAGTDGLFTLAVGLRGATELCEDLYEDPQFVHDLLSFLTEAIIGRIKAWREILGLEPTAQEWGFADDAIQLLSPAHYREFVLPYHRRLVETFSRGGPNSIHLCGQAQHHFVTLQKELNVQSFDTGYPTDLGRARRELGPGALLRGNIHPEVLLVGPTSAIEALVRNTLESGVMQGGRYIMCEGNNTAPHTPVKHLAVMYETAKEHGRYRQEHFAGKLA